MDFNYNLKEFGTEFYFNPTDSRRSYLISGIDENKPLIVMGISKSGSDFSKIYDISDYIVTDLAITFAQEVDFTDILSIVIKNYVSIPMDLPTTDEKLEDLRQYVISMSERVMYAASSTQGQKPNPNMSEGEMLIWRDNAWKTIVFDVSIIEGIDDVFEQNRLLYEKMVADSKVALEELNELLKADQVANKNDNISMQQADRDASIVLQIANKDANIVLQDASRDQFIQDLSDAKDANIIEQTANKTSNIAEQEANRDSNIVAQEANRDSNIVAQNSNKDGNIVIQETAIDDYTKDTLANLSLYYPQGSIEMTDNAELGFAKVTFDKGDVGNVYLKDSTEPLTSRPNGNTIGNLFMAETVFTTEVEGIIETFEKGDYVVWFNERWWFLKSGIGGAVESVNGKKGVIVLGAADFEDVYSITEVNAYVRVPSNLLTHDIGDYWITESTENPATRWAGTTWSKLEERFLIGASSSYIVGQEGGVSKITLTNDQLPSHRHNFTGDATNSTGAHTHTVAHTHTQAAHTHTQTAHTHSVSHGSDSSPYNYCKVGISNSGTFDTGSAGGDTTGSATPVINSTTPTTSSTGDHTHTISGTIDLSGAEREFSILNPYRAVNIWRRLT